MPLYLEFIVITEFIDDGEDTFRTSSDKEPFSALAFKVANNPFVGTLTFNKCILECLRRKLVFGMLLRGGMNA